jgi:hypothetical protein
MKHEFDQRDENRFATLHLCPSAYPAASLRAGKGIALNLPLPLCSKVFALLFSSEPRGYASTNTYTNAAANSDGQTCFRPGVPS